MQSLRNRVQLIGHLGQDPEVKEYEKGKKASFSIATNDFYKNQEGNKVEATQWHNVVVWGKKADVVEKCLKKGSEIAVEGRLVHRSYETATGEKRYISEISVNELLMLGKP